MSIEKQKFTLVITIIVMLVLAGVSLNAIVGDNGIVNQAATASIKQVLASYKEELEMNLVEVYDDANNVNCVGEEMKKYIPSLDDSELEEFVIYKGKLMYIGADENRSIVANSLGIESGSETTKDIVKVTDIVNTICSSVTPPADDTQKTPENCIGTRLYDKNNQNSINWNVVIEYSNSNEEKARYGSGWFLLKSGTILEDGTEIKNDYVINYGTTEMVLLSNYKEWNIESQLGVTDGLVLNIDAKNLSDGEWQGVTKYGDVEYDDASGALVFNEDELNNPNGEGGYLKYLKTGLDFSDGLTFEYYYNTSRGAYKKNGNSSLGFFIKIPSLDYEFADSLRMIVAKPDMVGSVFNMGSKVLYPGDNGYTLDGRGWGISNVADKLTKLNEDLYFTYTFVVYKEGVENELYDEYMKENKYDKCSYYLNGELIQDLYYDPLSYREGLKTWNHDDIPMYLGVCPSWSTNNLYYFKGNVYACRLYDKALDSDEVKLNYDSAVQFRNSGL